MSFTDEPGPPRTPGGGSSATPPDPRAHSDNDAGDEILPTSREQVLADYQKRKSKWYPDIQNTPCARESLIHGILGGMGTGLLYFLKSNVVMRSCDFAVGGFILIGYGSWRLCRYQMAKQQYEMKKTVDRMNELGTAKRRAEQENTLSENSPTIT